MGRSTAALAPMYIASDMLFVSCRMLFYLIIIALLMWGISCRMLIQMTIRVTMDGEEVPRIIRYASALAGSIHPTMALRRPGQPWVRFIPKPPWVHRADKHSKMSLAKEALGLNSFCACFFFLRVLNLKCPAFWRFSKFCIRSK